MPKIWKIILILTALAAIIGGGYFIFNNTKTVTFVNRLPADNGDLRDYFEKARELAQQPAATSTVDFLAVGDIMMSRNVAGSIAKSGNTSLPFKQLKNLLKSTDFNFGNLESPMSGSNYFNPSGSLIFNAPTSDVASLKNFNFKILNLANNHAFDQGLKGLDYTRNFLDQLGIQHIGTGDNLDQAWQPAIVTVNGIKIAFLGASFSSINDGGKTKNNYVARIEDLQRLKSAIDNLKSKADFIVVTMHAGTEYTLTPNAAQATFAHAAIDYGADMVIGAHPHWVQSIEKYKDKYIFYSLGNFIFDQEWSQQTKEGLALKIQIYKNSPPGSEDNAANLEDLQGNRATAKLDEVQLIPLIIENYSTPRPANEQESKNILSRIGLTSDILK